MANLVVRKCDGSCDVLKDCEQKMAVFCAMDPSYIEYDVKGRPSERDTIREKQVSAMNRSMQTRSPLGAWQNLLDKPDKPLNELESITTDLDLIAVSDDQWDGEVRGKLASLYKRVLGAKGIGAASGTKVLHLMRPRLVAIADSVVVDYLGTARGGTVDTALATADAVRGIGRTEGNGETLSRIQDYLRTAGVIECDVIPSACRIIDALLWMHANGLKRPEKAGYHRLWRQMGLTSP